MFLKLSEWEERVEYGASKLIKKMYQKSVLRVVARSDNPSKSAVTTRASQKPRKQSDKRYKVKQKIMIDYRALSAPTTLVSDALASPKSNVVFESKSSSFSIPAKPGRIERFKKMTFPACATSRIGIP